MITHYDEDNSTVIKAGDHILCRITAETGKSLISTFITICNSHSQELTELGIEYEAKRNWNIASNGHGRNWPIFSRREKFLNQLLSQAGIKDS